MKKQNVDEEHQNIRRDTPISRHIAECEIELPDKMALQWQHGADY